MADRPSRTQRRHVYRRTGPARPRFAPRTFKPEVDCRIKELCGACEFVNAPYRDGLEIKHKRGVAVLEEAGVLSGARILPPTPAPKPLAYRSHFKLAVRPGQRGERFAIGLFQPGTHKVVEIDDCPLHVPPLKRLIKDLRRELETSPLTPYDETTGKGDLRYLAARSAHLTGELMVTFVVTHDLHRELFRLVQVLRQRGHKISAAFQNLNDAPGNAIFGPNTERIARADRLRERICDLDYEIGPTSFFQINPWQAINLYRRLEQVVENPDGDQVAWDLYCGIGQISLILARAGYRVLGIEENPEAVRDAEVNARKNHLEDRAAFLAGRVEDVETDPPAWAREPNLIVVNPSRRGLAPETRKRLAALAGRREGTRFVYVSCDVTTLARDLAELTSGKLRLRQVEAFDMFPQTGHLEWLCVLTT